MAVSHPFVDTLDGRPDNLFGPLGRELTRRALDALLHPEVRLCTSEQCLDQCSGPKTLLRHA